MSYLYELMAQKHMAILADGELEAEIDLEPNNPAFDDFEIEVGGEPVMGERAHDYVATHGRL